MKFHKTINAVSIFIFLLLISLITYNILNYDQSIVLIIIYVYLLIILPFNPLSFYTVYRMYNDESSSKIKSVFVKTKFNNVVIFILPIFIAPLMLNHYMKYVKNDKNI